MTILISAGRVWPRLFEAEKLVAQLQLQQGGL